jgi:hypothetical protein
MCGRSRKWLIMVKDGCCRLRASDKAQNGSKTRVVALKLDGHNPQAQGRLVLTQKGSIHKMRTQNTGKTQERARSAPDGVLTVDEVAVALANQS